MICKDIHDVPYQMTATEKPVGGGEREMMQLESLLPIPQEESDTSGKNYEPSLA